MSNAKLGFLLQTIESLSNHLDTGSVYDEAAQCLATWLKEGRAKTELLKIANLPHETLPYNDLSPSVQESLFQHYGYFVAAWVHGIGENLVPHGLAAPLVRLGEILERPPVLGYAGQVLSNWRLINPDEAFVPENIQLIQHFTDLVDESWFFRVHIAIEAQAAPMLHAFHEASNDIQADDEQGVYRALRTMQSGLRQITKTFHEMPKLCDPDVYYQSVRTLLMSFGKEVIYEGIQPNPTPLRGGSGAQSSIVPAMLAGLGIDHASNDLTANLLDMRRYMPKEHRDFINSLYEHPLRDYCKASAPLRDAYNHVLNQLIVFRRAHLYYAKTYIFEKSTNPVGTGGTEYMSFLSKLIDETAEQAL